jgi:nitrate reductase NapE component
MTKKGRKKYELIPPKIAKYLNLGLWVMVSVDLVGTFTIRILFKTYSLLVITMIDLATEYRLVRNC